MTQPAPAGWTRRTWQARWNDQMVRIEETDRHRFAVVVQRGGSSRVALVVEGKFPDAARRAARYVHASPGFENAFKRVQEGT